MILLGLDAGSTAIKCVAFSEEGRQLALAYTEYGTSAGAGNMDADAMFAAAKQVIARCTADDAVDASDIAAIAVTSFGEACVPVDHDGACLSNMLMYTDNRGQLEAKRVLDSLGADRVGEITCTEFAPMYSLPKIIWLMDRDVPRVRRTGGAGRGRRGAALHRRGVPCPAAAVPDPLCQQGRYGH